MKLNFAKFFIPALACITLLSCCKTPPAPDIPQDSHTLIVYLMANNNLEGALSANITSIMQGMNSDFPEDANIYVYWHGTREQALYRLVPPASSKESATKILIKDYNSTGQSSVDPTVMKSILNEVKSKSPAERYGIVLGSHGMGWVPGNFDLSKPQCSGGFEMAPGYSYIEHDLRKAEDGEPTRYFGWDGSIKMSIEDLVEGLSAIHFDYILFDACFMSSIEAVWDMRGSADYIIASPAEILEAGFPYSDFIPVLFNPGSLDFESRLQKTAKSFVDYYLQSSGYKSASIVLFKTDKLPALAQSVKTILAGPLKAYDITQLQKYEKLTDGVFFDLHDYMYKICDNTLLFSAFETALTDAMVYEGHTPTLYGNVGGSGVFDAGRAKGVATYIPRSRFPKFMEAYNKTGWAKTVNAPSYD